MPSKWSPSKGCQAAVRAESGFHCIAVSELLPAPGTGSLWNPLQVTHCHVNVHMMKEAVRMGWGQVWTAWSGRHMMSGAVGTRLFSSRFWAHHARTAFLEVEDLTHGPLIQEWAHALAMSLPFFCPQGLRQHHGPSGQEVLIHRY